MSELMNGASLLPTIWPRLLFSITMVNTLPCQSGDGWVSVAESSLQATAVLPEVLAQPTATRARTGTSVSMLRIVGKVCRHIRAAQHRRSARSLSRGLLALEKEG